MILNKLVLQSLFLLGSYCIAVAEDNTIIADKPWPKIKTAIVISQMSLNASTYIYSYTLLNPNVNDVDFCVFSIDIRNNPLEHPFVISDITKEHTKQVHSLIIAQAKSITPVNIISPAKKFKNAVLRPAWSSISPSVEYWILPGDSLDGFKIFAKEPAGIREFHIRGITQDFYEYPEKFIHPIAKNHSEFIDEVNKGINYYGKTIAPVAPPAPFTVAAWTRRMTEDAIEARKLKWIKTDKHLAEIKKLIKNLNTSDQAKLKAAILAIDIYVQSEKKKGRLTDEADALIRLNAHYILGRDAQSEIKVSTPTVK